ncbi:unnamed protein product [Angiostrongylus costaricensis]|uniref:Uncharacterized protein n=1 Tax=Angiostrongylus costaricensis TaxID=334426 RepID=A0A158PMG7_ANGCS|nr:unnamed protein product [Angiostrongylus costaricensis]
MTGTIGQNGSLHTVPRFSKIDYTLLIIGLIASVVLSVLLSFICCLLCNGCWLHRRRNPQLYESVHESGWYPLCCGFGIPMGTVVFSTHPPQYRDDSEMYNSSSMSSLPSSKQRYVCYRKDSSSSRFLKTTSEYPLQHWISSRS